MSDDENDQQMQVPSKAEIDSYLSDIGRLAENRKSASAQAGQATNLFSERFNIEKTPLKMFTTLAKKEPALRVTFWRQLTQLMEAGGYADTADLFDGQNAMSVPALKAAYAQMQALSKSTGVPIDELFPEDEPAKPAKPVDEFDAAAPPAPPAPSGEFDPDAEAAAANSQALGAGITRLDPGKRRRGRPRKGEGSYSVQ